jgi:two-component system chemotaxis response regulator CheB
MEKIKVAVVDDSSFMRKVIHDALESKGFEVISTGRNGADAVEIASKKIADVMTLDVQMPVMDGLEALKKIMEISPMPVIMVSSLTAKDTEITIKALAAGAFDFVTKPGGSITFDFGQIIEELSDKIMLASKYKVTKKIDVLGIQKHLTPKGTYDLLVIGASTGGPKALDILVPQFPADFPLPVIIVQHMPAKFTTTLAKRLSEESKMKIIEVVEKVRALPFKGYVAAGDFHLELSYENGIYLRPVDGQRINGVKPAIDYTLSSISKTELRTLFVILTGMGKDGTEGLKMIKRDKLTVIAESEKTAIVYGMPKSVVNAGLADYIVDLNDIPQKIMDLI